MEKAFARIQRDTPFVAHYIIPLGFFGALARRQSKGMFPLLRIISSRWDFKWNEKSVIND